MEARIPRTVPRSRGRVPPRSQAQRPSFRLVAAGGLVVAAILAASIATHTVPPDAVAPSLAYAGGEYVTYADFGTSRDVIWEASATRPAERHKLGEIPHANEYGIVPALSPDGATLAYTSLPPGTKAPSPDSPADLWLSQPRAGAAPRRVAAGFDLLVRPVWSADGAFVIVRRSGGATGPYQLVRVDLVTGAEASLVRSDSALFPIGFALGNSLYYASLSAAGSDIYRLAPADVSAGLMSHLSDDLTRDWALSPNGDRLAFVTLTQTAQRVSSRVQVLDLTSGAIDSQAASGDEFGPVWSSDGTLSFGRLGEGAGNGVVSGQSALASPARGFDLPLAWSRSGSNIAVRSFDGTSVTAPGGAALSVVTPGGSRQVIARGEVTFIGWTYH
jgi:hypothetical protein